MKKRLLSLALAAVMAFSSLALTACKPGSSVDGKPGKGALTTRDLTNIYKADSISTVGTIFENLQINQVYKMNDGKLLVCGYTTDTYEDKYYITDLDFKNASEMTIKKAEGQNTETYIQNVAVSPTDGSIWYVKNVYSYTDADSDQPVPEPDHTVPGTIVDDGAIIGGVFQGDATVDSSFSGGGYTENTNSYYLVKVDAEGNIVSETDISADLMVTDESGNSYQSTPNNLVFSGGKLLFCVETTIKVFNTDTVTKEAEYKITDQYIDNLYVGASGTVYYIVWGDGGQELFKFDPNTGKSEKTEFTGINQLYNYQFSPGSNGYEFTLINESGVFGYNPGDNAPTELCSYTNSDIDMTSGNASSPIFLDDGRILLSFYDYESSQNDILMLSKVDPSTVKEKYVITVGGRYIDYQIKRALLKFNRTSDEYKVVFKDYSKYDNESNNYNGAYEALDKDILSKNDAPDIIFVDSYGMDYKSYISKGVFANLEKFMEADESFNKDDYLANVFEASKINGHLYTIVPTVNFMTLAGKKSIFGDRTHWTMKEFLEMHRSLGEGEQMISEATRDSYGSIMLMIAENEFIDENGNCSFDNDNFKDILAYIKDLPADYKAYQDKWQDNDNYWQEQQLSYSKGTTKLYTAYIYNFDMIPELENYMGEEVALIGFPTASEDASGVIIQPNAELAVNANSKVTAGCWEVLKYLLSDEYQNQFSGDRSGNSGRYGGGSYTFPIKKSIIEKKMKNDLLPRYYTEYDENGNETQVEQPRYTWVGDTRVEKRKSTEEDVARLYEMVNSANFFARENKDVNEIILNEAAPYFDNQKSVDEVVGIINSRVRLYVSQQR